MERLLSFNPAPFPELDREVEEYEADITAEELEPEGEIGRRRRPHFPSGPRRNPALRQAVRPTAKQRIRRPCLKPTHLRSRLRLRFWPIRPTRMVTIPLVPLLRDVLPDSEPTVPRDQPPPDDYRPGEQPGPEGSGTPPPSQPSDEPASENARWVQDCLNRTLGLQLTVDGIMNRETRSAVRMFQERQGLPITGLVGPETETALKSACAAAPAASNGLGQTPEAEWESSHPESCSCPACNRRNAMTYRLSFEAEPFAGETEFEEFETLDLEPPQMWLGETGQDSPQHVRWIQDSLNKILGLQLKVDGIMGPNTRSAIRSFQQKQKLSVDGIADHKTEAAIKKILASAIAPSVPPSNTPAYTQCDFIHPNIDVAAQYALYGMLKSGSASRNASFQLLAAVKTGRLGGIYQEDQKVPGLRGIYLGYGGYGPLISTYRKSASSAACIPPAPHPSHKLPIVSFKKTLAKNISVLGEQLTQVYLDCQLPYLPPIPASGKSCTIPPPPDQKPPSEPSKTCRYPHCDPYVPWATCWTDDRGIAYRCLPIPGRHCGICEWAAKCKYPHCDTAYPGTYTCGVGEKCFPVPGERCGVCEGTSENAKRCFEDNGRRLRSERQKCSEEHKREFIYKYLPECGEKALKCVFAKDWKSCLKGLGCAVYPEPYEHYQECLRHAHERSTEEAERCRMIP